MLGSRRDITASMPSRAFQSQSTHQQYECAADVLVGCVVLVWSLPLCTELLPLQLGCLRTLLRRTCYARTAVILLGEFIVQQKLEIRSDH
eukprot:5156549-Amphidinium_carterae.1